MVVSSIVRCFDAPLSLQQLPPKAFFGCHCIVLWDFGAISWYIFTYTCFYETSVFKKDCFISDDNNIVGCERKNMERFTNLRVILAQGPC